MDDPHSRSSASRHLVDPELLGIIDAFPPVQLSAETLASFRERPIPQPEPSDEARRVEVNYRTIPGPKGAPAVPIGLYRPAAADVRQPAILHIHGGGYVSGSVRGTEVRQRELACTLGCIVVSVDYRLAPETRFPGAIEDCYAALLWLAAGAEGLPVDTDRVALKGESAGGGLAAALALLARDRGEVRPVLQHLTYPMLDDRTGTTKPPSRYAGEFVWTADNNRFGWSALLGCAPAGQEPSPYAAPARAKDLAGLAPAYIVVGALDLFADECMDYARRLTGAGVATELHVYAGGFHGFDLAPTAAVAKAARAGGTAALHRALHPAKSGVITD